MQAPSCGMWDLVPWPGIEPGPLHWEHGVLTTGPPGKSPYTNDLKLQHPPISGRWRAAGPALVVTTRSLQALLMVAVNTQFLLIITMWNCRVCFTRSLQFQKSANFFAGGVISLLFWGQTFYGPVHLWKWWLPAWSLAPTASDGHSPFLCVW